MRAGAAPRALGYLASAGLVALAPIGSLAAQPDPAPAAPEAEAAATVQTESEPAAAADGAADAERDAPGEAGSVDAVQREAQEHFRRGVGLVEEQRLPEAVDAFRASAALVSRASTLYNLALSLFRLGRHRECLDAVVVLESQLAASEAGDEGMRERAATLRKRATEQLARLVLLIDPADARLTIDGEPVWVDGATRALLLDPGPHRVRIERAGFLAVTRELQLRAGRAVRETIALRREPASEAEARAPKPESAAAPQAAVEASAARREPSRLAPAILLGGAGLLVAAGAVTGVVTADKDDAVRARCGGNFDNCPPSAMDDADEVERFALVTDLLLFGGAGLAIAGGILWLSGGEGDGAVHVGITPGGAAFRARF